MSFLLIERGPENGRRIPLQSFPVTLGRDLKNDIPVADEEISRFHLRIKKRGRLFIVEDLDSRNGTFINGDRIKNSVLKNNDKLLVGASELRFVTNVSDINLVEQISDYDMVIAEQLGLKGPIPLNDGGLSKEFTPQRIGRGPNIHKVSTDHNTAKNLLEFSGNVMVAADLEEAGNSFLKSIGKLNSGVSRAALFTFSDGSRSLTPIAVRHYRRKKVSFLLSQRAFADVITRKQGIILKASSANVTQEGRSRVLLPLLRYGKPICILHLEYDQPLPKASDAEIDLIQSFMFRCASTFETFLLRRELDNWTLGSVESIMATIEAKDTYTRGHSERVSRYSMAIAEELRLDRETKKYLLISSLCHDVGKIGIPDAILKKASLLSTDEYDEMKLHPTIGADIIDHLPNSQRIISGVKHHHEKWDGTGYPSGMIGEEIPFFARIVAIADVFDAMVSGRTYSGFLDQNEAIERIEQEKDLFDPEIFKTFLKAYENGTLTLKTGTQNQVDPEDDADELTFKVLKTSGG